MSRKLQVGIVGASAGRGWARDSHVPALQLLSGLSLGAVASGNQAKSDAAANAFGASTGYAEAADLIRDAAIDIVAVCVKVPDHGELVLAAVHAGKHVYCEWPLGRNLAETEELAAAAKAAGVHVAIGLQTRANPVLRQARALVASGAIGSILSARIFSSTVAFGPAVEAAMAFAEDPAGGVTLVTIQGAHTVDAAIAVLGELKSAGALASIQYPQVKVGEQATPRTRSTPDHLLVQSELATGGVLSIETAGGRPADEVTFSFQVTGSRGTLALHGGAIRGFQSGTLALSLNGKPHPVDAGALRGMPEAALNVAGTYAALRDDIHAGTNTVPDFEHAVALTKLMDDLLLSSEDGRRRRAAGWPLA